MFQLKLPSAVACLPLLVIGAVWFCLFWQMNSGQTVIGFRDSAYLYYPYFEWIDQQWAAGELPLWNPYCDLGHPVVGDGTSSVFYPGKLVFFLRFLSFPSRYGLYLSLHVLWAAIGTWWLVRKLGGGTIGAGLGAISYAFGGSVLFQTTNVVFLVSAAWLPFGLGFLWQMFKRNSIGNAVCAGSVCAMMILGGDPQMAYLLILIAAGLALGFLFCQSITGNGRRIFGLSLFGRKLTRFRFLVFASRQIALMILAVLGLAAVQVLPTYVWASQSTRLEAGPQTGWHLFETLQAGSAREATYQFSQPPWSLAELIVPNVSGKPYPTHQRWTRSLPGDDQYWTPSLYVGLVAIVFAISRFRLWGRQRRLVWLTRLGLFFCLASFGWYGGVWLYNELAGALRLPIVEEIAKPVGGLYWMMTCALPKFYLFRYPAKLFVVASLAICTLGGVAVQQGDHQKSLSIIPLVLVFASSLGVYAFGFNHLFSCLGTVDVLFGPFDAEGAAVGLRRSLLHVLVVALVLLTVAGIRTMNRKPGGKRVLLASLACFFLAISELLVANHWLLPQVDQRAFVESTDIETAISALQTDEKFLTQVCFVRNPGAPEKWSQEFSKNRLTEVVVWQRETMHPKHNLLQGCRVIGSFSSVESKANREFVAKHFEAFELKKIEPTVVDRIWFAPIETDLNQLDRQWRKYWESVENEPQFTVAIQDVTTSRIVFRCEPTEASRLAFNTLPASGWKIKVVDLSSQKVQNCHVQGSKYFITSQIPAGKLEVEIKYEPMELWIGAWISGFFWASLLGFVLLGALRRLRQKLL